MSFRVVTHSGSEYNKADYVKFEGVFVSFWKKAAKHTGRFDELVVAYNADQVEFIDRVEKAI